MNQGSRCRPNRKPYNQGRTTQPEKTKGKQKKKKALKRWGLARMRKGAEKGGTCQPSISTKGGMFRIKGPSSRGESASKKNWEKRVVGKLIQRGRSDWG